jgi:hypothetical protein
VLATVGHQRHALGQRGERAAVDGRVRHYDVVAPEPQRLGQREREDPGQPGVQRAVDQRPAAHRFRGQPDALAARAALEIGGIGVERVEVEGGERRVQVGRSGMEGLQHADHASRRTRRRALR